MNFLVGYRHADFTHEKNHHCPLKECETFWLWILENCILMIVFGNKSKLLLYAKNVLADFVCAVKCCKQTFPAL